MRLGTHQQHTRGESIWIAVANCEMLLPALVPQIEMMQRFAGVEIRLMKKSDSGAAQFKLIIAGTSANQRQKLLLASRDRVNAPMPHGMMSRGYKIL